MMTAYSKDPFNIMVYLRNPIGKKDRLKSLLEQRLELSEYPYVLFTVLSHYDRDYVVIKRTIEEVLGEGVHYDVINYRVTGWGETGGIFHFGEVARIYYPRVVITDSSFFAEFVEARKPITIQPRITVYLL